MKKALIITYYWPPSGGAGVQRWLKFVKYLRDYGWEPIVYTPSNPESPTNDTSLEKDIPKGITILKTEIWEPYSWYKKLIGQKKDDKINAAFLSESEKPKMMERFSVWVRGNFFVPDARVFWVKPSIKYLSAYLAKNPVDVIISTGPPHSMHLIAAGLKKKLNIPWLADFRDPWTNIDFYSKLMLSPAADKKHHKLELDVLQKADAITCVGRTMIEEFKQILKNSTLEKKFHFIPNGFDPEDYKNETALSMDKKFSMSHIGMLDKTRNPEALWKVLSQLVKNNPAFAADLEIKLVGKTDFAVNADIEQYDLAKYLTKIAYLSHHEVTLAQKQSQVLLLLINNTPNALGIITGKFFEYMAAHRPIICIGPSGGDVDKILSETNSGYLSGYDDTQALEKNILVLYDKFKKGTLSSENKNIEKYSRKELSNDLSKVLNTIAK
ncbi:MAG TPA: glycosyltransferase family 4 protein [Bacteroidia bacterium]|jgi:glycosyltransferase involved in cell wall biosynthesis|nr:glycosyltransferase family 4 protein [Bacteroidia bacterium]